MEARLLLLIAAVDRGLVMVVGMTLMSRMQDRSSGRHPMQHP